MIVNVNPHDTGYQENSQVMEFSALATQVQTSALERFRQPFMKGFDAVKSKVQTGSVSKTQNKITVLVPAPAALQPEDGRLQQGEVTQSSFKLIEEHLEVVEGGSSQTTWLSGMILIIGSCSGRGR
jgi:kinesin family protein 20